MNIFFWLLIFIAVTIILAAISVLFPAVGAFFNSLWDNIMDILSK